MSPAVAKLPNLFLVTFSFLFLILPTRPVLFMVVMYSVLFYTPQLAISNTVAVFGDENATETGRAAMARPVPKLRGTRKERGGVAWCCYETHSSFKGRAGSLTIRDDARGHNEYEPK